MPLVSLMSTRKLSSLVFLLEILVRLLPGDAEVSGFDWGISGIPSPFGEGMNKALGEGADFGFGCLGCC